MTTTRHNRWMKFLAILLVIVIIVMLLIPAELTDEQLTQVQPGMTLDQVQTLLGKPFKGDWTHYSMAEPIEGTDVWGFRMTHHGQFWKPSISVTYTADTGREHSIWIGKTRLLWVEHNNDTITKTWLFPIMRYGGGLDGCISSLRYYWKRQTGTLTTSPQVR